MSDRQDADEQIGFDERENEESFLARWSRRKRAEQAQTPSVSTPMSDCGGRSQDGACPGAASQHLTDADMPPLETLDESSDYGLFLSPGVSEALRKQALDRLFHLPNLHKPDGLDDYDEDFTRLVGLGNVITHEMRRALERELQVTNGPDQDSVDASADRETDAMAADSGDTAGRRDEDNDHPAEG